MLPPHQRHKEIFYEKIAWARTTLKLAWADPR